MFLGFKYRAESKLIEFGDQGIDDEKVFAKKGDFNMC